jgi:hypothetical protein
LRVQDSSAVAAVPACRATAANIFPKIRTFNDRFRKSLTGGRVMMTAAVSALPDKVRARAIELTRTFDNFIPDNDRHNKHDFRSFETHEIESENLGIRFTRRVRHDSLIRSRITC